MGKKLVLAEKPSVARDIAKVLKCYKTGKGFIEGDKYVVTWALGHLVTLADPEAYDERYKKWSMDTLPMLPKKMKLVVIGKTAKHFSDVKKVMTRNDIDEMILATDPAREGELVGRWIIEKVGFKKPIRRLWISSQTDKAIKDGFNNLKPGENYIKLYESAVCRAEADWLVGLNVTRALTCKYNAQLSAGRVQTPTLAMIIQRENDIRNFKPKDYYRITASADGFTLQWKNKKGESRIFDQNTAENIKNKVNGKNGKIIEVEESLKKKTPPLLYDLTELQRDANRIYGYSAKQTLSLMQRLYEIHKILTYPRTDSRYIPTDVVATIPDRLKAISVGNYSMFTRELLKKKITGNKGFVDNNKISDHHAIIPTEQHVILSDLSFEERNIFDLVVKRFLSVLMPPSEYLKTNIKADINGEIFTASGKVVKSKGWTAVYDKNINLESNENDEENDEQNLPELKKNDLLKINSVNIKKQQTKPPARFNEGTLLSAMENPQKYVSMDKESAKTLGETGGLGTVATRADIIEKLYNTFYIERNGKEIIPTSKGRQVVGLVPEDLKSPLLTATWESKLELISKGKLDGKEFINNMRSYTIDIVNDVKSSSRQYVHDNITKNKCPNCGKFMLEVNGKYGKMLVCSDRECGYRKPISRMTMVRCPQCHKRLELMGEGDGQIYVCPNCSFREKLSVFKKNNEGSENKKTSKRDVAIYMNKMKKENDEFTNPAIAEAFKKLNLKQK